VPPTFSSIATKSSHTKDTLAVRLWMDFYSGEELTNDHLNFIIDHLDPDDYPADIFYDTHKFYPDH